MGLFLKKVTNATYNVTLALCYYADKIYSFITRKESYHVSCLFIYYTALRKIKKECLLREQSRNLSKEEALVRINKIKEDYNG